ncbi:MAG: hypothetical protein SGI72_04065 [Planctomycetota bacterium]|nr:hypothetical protein [Planctomycetota bacterium]
MTARRVTVPVTHRSPSPKSEPDPADWRSDPWKYNTPPFGIASPRRINVSLDTLATPTAVKLAPTTNAFLQPKRAPLKLALPHGQAVPDPSPKQNAVPTTGRVGPTRCSFKNATAATSIAPPPNP